MLERGRFAEHNLEQASIKGTLATPILACGSHYRALMSVSEQL